MAVCHLPAGSGLGKLSPALSSTLRPEARRCLHASNNLCFRRSSQPQLGAQISRRSRLEARIPSTGGSGNLGGSTGDGSGGGGGDDGGDESTGEGSSGEPNGVGPLLLTLGRSLESFPAIFAAALKEGKVSISALELYLRLEGNPLMRPLLGIAGFRERLMADSGFLVKLGIELGIGLICKVTAEWEKRRDGFKRELDFVFANVVMALIADFMLVWLPAPTLSFSGQAASARSAGRFQGFMRSCPDNAFQRVPAGGEAWSVLQRTAAVGRNGAKLLGVGFFASLCGVTITNLLLEVRKQIDPSFKPQNAPQNVLVTSSLYASYMASSSNIRYQIIAGVIEERGIERIFAGNAAVCGIASLVIRTANTFVGSLLWVDYLRLCGFQKKTVYETPPSELPAKKQ